MNKVDNQLKEIIKGAILEVQSTPSSVKQPSTLPPESVRVLTDRLGDEYNAHFFYVNAANWCQGVGYFKAATFFTAEAASELTHAQLLQKYLVDWNVTPIIPTPKTETAFTTLIDIVSKAYDMEYALFKAYNQTSTSLFPADLATFDFLQQLRVGQTTAVAEYSDLLNAAMLINVNNAFELLYYEQTYFG